MLKTLRTILAPPQFDDLEENRIARLLNGIILMLAGISLAEIIFGIIWLSIDFNTVEYAASVAELITTFLFLITLLTLKYLIHRGMVRIASWTLITSLLLYSILIVADFGGVRDSGGGVFLIVIMLAALLLGRRANLIFTSLSVLATLTIYLLQINHIIAFDMPADVNFIEWATLAEVLIIAGLLQRNATGDLQEAYLQARKNESELIRSNQELDNIREGLEQTVARRTETLERRTRFLEASSIITQETTSILDPQLLLEKVVSLISTHFSFYHVGIFLVDKDSEWAVLRAASSLGGRQMIARDHKLRVGRQGIVGYVTGIGQARISQSIELDRIHTLTQELPDTRAEMALPLKARGEIIGALDIQSTEEHTFNEIMINVLQSLANQIALAISNAQLYQQSQQSIEDARRAYGEYNQQAWIEAQRRGSLPSYLYTADGTASPTRINTKPLYPKKESGTIEVPIRVRGQMIGKVDIIKKGDTQEWSLEEKDLLEVLTDQLGIALDSARLFEETQQRAATERMVSEISTEIRETLTLDTVLKTAAKKVREAMGLPELTIRLAQQTDAPQTPKPSNGSNDDRPAATPPATDQTLELED